MHPNYSRNRTIDFWLESPRVGHGRVWLHQTHSDTRQGLKMFDPTFTLVVSRVE